MYLSDLSSSSSDEISIGTRESISNTRNKAKLTRGEKVRRKFGRRMKFFLAEGGSCSYDDESIGDMEVPLRYKHLLKQWVPKELPELDTDFCVNERMYRIAPSSIHGLGLFSMDGIKVKYGGLVELFEYVGPCYTYGVWLRLVQYMPSMRRYALAANYIQLKDNNKNKGATVYIDGRPKASGNIAGLINSTRPGTTRKEPNCIFEEREGNRIFVCAVKTITAGEELLIDYNLNRVDPGTSSFATVQKPLYPNLKLFVKLKSDYLICECFICDEILFYF
jgi:hypothetical protein